MSDVARVQRGVGECKVVQEKQPQQLGATQVAVDVHYVALNDTDVRFYRNSLQTSATTTATAPYTPGHVLCGVVKQVGGAVEHVAVEQRVCGFVPVSGEGVCRERARLDALCVTRVPDSLDRYVCVCVCVCVFHQCVEICRVAVCKRCVCWNLE
jgi:NADPH:quinone reductase-like Zn-dependent oxidoreductase